MSPKLLLYGATGFVGAAIVRLAVERGLRPILGGRAAHRLEPLASSLGLEYRAFPLNDTALVDGAFDGIGVVLVAALLRTVPYARALFANATVQTTLKRLFRMQAGSTIEQRARTSAHVWGLVEDDAGRSASARLHGPEAGVVWTGLTALAAVQRVLSGDAPAGFQTPSLAYGPDFVMSCAGVTREDL